ncbi:hypothetical protein WKH53_14270 [Pantoea agglomerans]|uniref:hypothetical protein n=1 Tax=Pantoea TaxID=53335 RepID=UPI0012AE793E|nr:MULTISPECIES: hypothetical protein [Pantoea]MRT10323.1 hypothetical protein [Pantoea agglomerans]
MNAEPVLSEISIYRPALTGVDMHLYNSPATIQQLMQERKEKHQGKQQKENRS